MSEPDADVATVLLAKARADLSAAHLLIAADDADEEIIGFHLQQAVEKALKSVLAARGGEVPHTHNLGFIVELLADKGIEVPDDLARPQWLTPWGVAFRYVTAAENLDTDRGLKAAAAAIELAQRK